MGCQIPDQGMPVAIGTLSGGAGCQQRQQGQNRNHGDILKQQHRECILAGLGFEQTFLLQRLQHNGCGRQRQRQGDGGAGLPAVIRQQHQHRANQYGGEHHLRTAQPQNRLAQLPQLRGLQLQTDQEQHHHHAELGKVHDVLLVAHQTEHIGANQQTCNQITQYRTKAQTFGHRHRDHCGTEVNQCVLKHGRLP